MSQLIKKEDRYFKECNVVMLPTEDYTNIVNHGTGLDPYHKTKSEIKFAIEQIGGTPQHLYFISDDEIKEGDWVIEQTGLGYLQPYRLGSIRSEEYINRCKKIIATTDFLMLPPKNQFSSQMERVAQPSHKFIKAFCEQGGIDKVLVEYESIGTNEDQLGVPIDYEQVEEIFVLKTDTHNTITIKPVKDSWTREEHIANLEAVMSLGINYQKYGSKLSPTEELKGWIKENL